MSIVALRRGNLPTIDSGFTTLQPYIPPKGPSSAEQESGSLLVMTLKIEGVRYCFINNEFDQKTGGLHHQLFSCAPCALFSKVTFLVIELVIRDVMLK